MSFRATVLRVLLASPGDTSPERDAISEALSRWNGRRASREQMVLVQQRWEFDAIPVLGGGDGQANTNAQLVDSADIVLAVFDARLGTATARAVSGTSEEITRAHAAGKPVHVWFSQEDLPRDIDLDQLRRVREFEQSLRDQGLLGRYHSPEDLAASVRDAIEFDLDQMRSRGLVEDLDALPTQQRANEVLNQLAEARARASQADARVIEVAEALLAFTEALSPVLRQLAELSTQPPEHRSAGLQRVVSAVLHTRAVLFPTIDGVRMVVYRIARTGGVADRLIVDNWDGRPRDRPHEFVAGDGGRGDKAFAWLRAGGGVPRFTPDTRVEPDPDWQGSGSGYQTYVSLPLVVGDEVHGMITVDAPSPGDLDETDQPALELLAQCMALGYALS